MYFDKKLIKTQYPNPFIRDKTADDSKAEKENERKREKQADNTLHRCFDAMHIFESALRSGANSRPQLAGYFKNNLKGRKVALLHELYAFDQQLILQ